MGNKQNKLVTSEYLDEKERKKYEDCKVSKKLLKLITYEKRKELDDLCEGFFVTKPPELPTWPHTKELRLVLLGKSGCGKSSTGNLIVGNDAFTASYASQSVTSTIKEASVMFGKIKVRVIDTPGFYDTKVSHRDIMSEVIKVMETFSDGIHMFLLVMNSAQCRFTEDQEKIFKLLKEDMFGKKFLDCCFLVMSHGSGIEKGLGNHIEDEISAKSRFGTIIKEDLNRNVFAVENYCGVPYLRKKQQEHIIRQLAGHISRFGEKPYTHDVHQKHLGETHAEIQQSLANHLSLFEKELSKGLNGMTRDQIISLNKEDEKKRKLVEDTVDKVDEHIEAGKFSRATVTAQVQKLLDAKIYRVTNAKFQDEMDKDHSISRILQATQSIQGEFTPGRTPNPSPVPSPNTSMRKQPGRKSGIPIDKIPPQVHAESKYGLLLQACDNPVDTTGIFQDCPKSPKSTSGAQQVEHERYCLPIFPTDSPKSKTVHSPQEQLHFVSEPQMDDKALQTPQAPYVSDLVRQLGQPPIDARELVYDFPNLVLSNLDSVSENSFSNSKESIDIHDPQVASCSEPEDPVISGDPVNQLGLQSGDHEVNLPSFSDYIDAKPTCDSGQLPKVSVPQVPRGSDHEEALDSLDPHVPHRSDHEEYSDPQVPCGSNYEVSLENPDPKVPSGFNLVEPLANPDPQVQGGSDQDRVLDSSDLEVPFCSDHEVSLENPDPKVPSGFNLVEALDNPDPQVPHRSDHEEYLDNSDPQVPLGSNYEEAVDNPDPQVPHKSDHEDYLDNSEPQVQYSSSLEEALDDHDSQIPKGFDHEEALDSPDPQVKYVYDQDKVIDESDTQITSGSKHEESLGTPDPQVSRGSDYDEALKGPDTQLPSGSNHKEGLDNPDPQAQFSFDHGEALDNHDPQVSSGSYHEGTLETPDQHVLAESKSYEVENIGDPQATSCTDIQDSLEDSDSEEGSNWCKLQ